ncbi:MAG TPA: hypothetical protein VGB30_12815 [bacterium]|jgi:hypothetical protein
MFKRFSMLTIAAIIAFGISGLPAYAQYGGNPMDMGTFSLGGGWWSMPDAGDGIDNSGLYVAGQYRAEQYMLEFDISMADTQFYALAADYLYSLAEGGYSMASGAVYIGAGYTYFSSDDLDNESGLNAILAAEVGDQLFGSIRYDWLGGDQDMFTLGITYSFY